MCTVYFHEKYMSSIYSLSCPVQLAVLSGGRFVLRRLLAANNHTPPPSSTVHHLHIFMFICKHICILLQVKKYAASCQLE